MKLLNLFFSVLFGIVILNAEWTSLNHDPITGVLPVILININSA